MGRMDGLPASAVIFEWILGFVFFSMIGILLFRWSGFDKEGYYGDNLIVGFLYLLFMIATFFVAFAISKDWSASFFTVVFVVIFFRILNSFKKIPPAPAVKKKHSDSISRAEKISQRTKETKPRIDNESVRRSQFVTGAPDVKKKHSVNNDRPEKNTTKEKDASTKWSQLVAAYEDLQDSKSRNLKRHDLAELMKEYKYHHKTPKGKIAVTERSAAELEDLILLAKQEIDFQKQVGFNVSDKHEKNMQDIMKEEAEFQKRANQVIGEPELVKSNQDIQEKRKKDKIATVRVNTESNSKINQDEERAMLVLKEIDNIIAAYGENLPPSITIYKDDWDIIDAAANRNKIEGGLHENKYKGIFLKKST